MKNHKILLVEDNRDLIEAYTLIFQKEGFEVEKAYNGNEALEKIALFSPDIVLLDIMMPYMNGFEFLKRLKEKKIELKIIIQSNLYQENEVKKSLQLGADMYLKKSDYTVQELVKKVKTLLAC